MRIFDDIMLGLDAARVAGKPSARTQSREIVSAGEDLVHIGLVAGVKDDRIARAVEDAVQGDRQLHNAEIGAEMSAGLRNGLDEKVADLLRELGQLLCRERLDRGRSGDVVQQTHGMGRSFRDCRGALTGAGTT